MNKTFNFLCPNGTIFSQENLVCVWWNQFDCNSAPDLYSNNEKLFEAGQQSAQGPDAQGGPSSNDYSGPTGGSDVSSASYPAAGQPQSPQSSFQGTNAPSGQGYPSGSAAPVQGYPSGSAAPAQGYPSGSAAPAQGYPSGSAAPAQGYPSGPSSPSGYPSSPAAGYPSTQGSYPSTQGPTGPYPAPASNSPNVPSSSYPAQAPQGFSPQADNGYPSGTPQTPTREYLPPRQG